MGMLKFRAPPLPISGREYKQDYFAQLIRALTLYFNQLDSLTPVQWESVTAAEFVGGDFSGRGQGIQVPYVSAADTTDQYATGDNTPTLVKWNTLLVESGLTLNSDGTVTTKYSGVYKIDYSLQFVNTNNASHDAFVWLKVDGINVPYSSSQFTLPARKSVGDPSALVAYSHITFSINANQKVALYWATDKAAVVSPPADGVYMNNIDAISSPYSRPDNPSAIGTIVFVSALPTPTVVGVYAAGYVGSVQVSIV